MTIALTSQLQEMRLSDTTGGLLSLQCQGQELCTPSASLAVLVFRVGDGERALHTRDFTVVSHGEGWLSFTDHPDAPSVRLDFALRQDQGRFAFRPTVSGIPDGWRLERLAFLPVHVSPEGSVLLPFSDGMLCTAPPSGHSLQLDTPPPTQYFRYPGRLQMQFLAHCRPQGGGVYLGVEDPEHGPKNIFFQGDEDWQLVISMYVCSQGDTYRTDAEFVIAGFTGDWRGAAELYRDYVYREGKLTRVEAPWIADSPVVVTYSITGEGPMSAEANCFFPYTKALEPLRSIATHTQSKILAFLLRADGHGPWTPPFVWPPRGGADLFGDFIRKLHAEGHYVGIYGSGLSLTTKGLLTNYTEDATPFQHDLAHNRDGSLIPTNIGGVRESSFLCPAQPGGRNAILSQAQEVARAGVDFFQIFDQNLGGAFFRSCYATDHDHPQAPDRWETQAWSSLFQEINLTTSPLVIGTECAAAHPFVNLLPFNDLRPQFAWGQASATGIGQPVPLYAFVFHEFVTNFSGNQCMSENFDHLKSPENLLWRTAYGFNSGDLLTFPMRKNGEADWGAAAPWSLPEPDTQALLTLIRNLNQCRKQRPEFLRFGKMTSRTHRLEGPTITFSHTKRGTFETEAFFATEWESPQGKRALILTNFLNRQQQVRVDGKDVTLPPLDAMVLEQD